MSDEQILDYQQVLNEKLDATVLGAEIKMMFDQAVKRTKNLKVKCEGARDENGDFNNPVLSAFTVEEQDMIKLYLDAIESASTVFLSAMDKINNPETSTTEA